jgi:hypothetical protein
MNDAPILAARSLPAGTNGYTVPLSFSVEGGLHYLRGNPAPHFSLTYTQHRRGFPGQCYSGGAGHETILRYYPRFADLAALHLADIDGVPMHAEANGWYWLAGAMGGAGERYHGGNTDPRGTTPAECLAIFARHCRITLDEAEAIRAECAAVAESLPEPGREWNWPSARATMAARLRDMRQRWKAEAEACIAHHELRVYGDPWPEVA